MESGERSGRGAVPTKAMLIEFFVLFLGSIGAIAHDGSLALDGQIFLGSALTAAAAMSFTCGYAWIDSPWTRGVRTRSICGVAILVALPVWKSARYWIVGLAYWPLFIAAWAALVVVPFTLGLAARCILGSRALDRE